MSARAARTQYGLFRFDPARSGTAEGPSGVRLLRGQIIIGDGYPPVGIAGANIALIIYFRAQNGKAARAVPHCAASLPSA